MLVVCGSVWVCAIACPVGQLAIACPVSRGKVVIACNVILRKYFGI